MPKIQWNLLKYTDIIITNEKPINIVSKDWDLYPKFCNSAQKNVGIELVPSRNFTTFQIILLFETTIKWNNRYTEQYEIMKKINIDFSLWNLTSIQLDIYIYIFLSQWLPDNFSNIFCDWLTNLMISDCWNSPVILSRNWLTNSTILSLDQWQSLQILFFCANC